MVWAFGYAIGRNNFREYIYKKKTRLMIESVNLEKIKFFLKEKFKVSEEQISRLVDSMKNSLTKRMDETAAAIKTGDLQTVSDACHSIKGILLQLELNDWVEIAAEMELNAKNKKEEKPYQEQLDQLRRGLHELL